MGMVLMVVWGGHALLFTLPSLVALAYVERAHRRRSGPRTPFWLVALLSGAAFSLFRVAYLLAIYRPRGYAGLWEIHLHSLFNLPLCAGYLLAGILLFWARQSARGRPIVQALLAGLFLSIVTQLPATFYAPQIYPALGVDLHH